MSKRGVVAIISGFSGAGKGTVVKELVKKYGYLVSVSATTREPRMGEQEGVDYFFKTREEFEGMIARDELIEYAQYVGNYYGTPKQYVMDQVAQGRDVILEIEMQGALKVREKLPEVSLVFVAPPSAKELKNRLIGRGTESMEVIDRRMARAKEECAFMEQYDYLVVNDDLEECVQRLHQLLQCLHFSMEHQRPLIEKITKDFDKM